MAMRQRTPTFRPQLSVRRVYETMQPRSEVKESPEAYLLHVYLPGFPKDRIKITLEDSSKMVRIAGERPTQSNNRWVKIDQTYPIPENSEAETLEANFDQSTLILQIKKKVIPQLVAPKQEVEPKSPKHPSDDKPLDQEPKLENVQETIPPQPTTTKVEENEEKESAQKEDTSSQTPPQESITNDNPQKGKEEFEPKPIESTTKTQIDENPQKGDQEEVEPKPIEKTKTQIDENPQKGDQEEVEPKPTLTSTKEQLKENIVEKSVEEDVEKERILKKEAKEEHEKPSEIEKGKEAEEPLVPKVQEKEKESCCMGKSSGKNIVEGNGIKKLAASSSQFVTRMAERKWSDEERYLVGNIGAAVLVIAALGTYVSYRFAS